MLSYVGGRAGTTVRSNCRSSPHSTVSDFKNDLDSTAFSGKLFARSSLVVISLSAFTSFSFQSTSNLMSSLRTRIILCFLVLLAMVAPYSTVDILQISTTTAQGPRPVLYSEAESTRAIAVESVTNKHEPFSTANAVSFSPDNRTRVMLFAGNLHLAAGEGPEVVTADAEDGSHNIYQLKVEHVGPVPDQEWATSVIVKLDEQMGDIGDVLVRIYYKGIASNRVRVAVGHVGGGPPDDPGAVPTPGPVREVFPTNPVTAGTLTPDEVMRIIAQAVSAAVALNKAVTVAVTDREANVLGVFTMTGAPATTQFRGGGPGPVLIPDPITGFVPIGFDDTVVPAKFSAISKAATASLFITRGNAFTSRTASFIIQEHFPPGVDFKPGGPLYGVQFSSLPCSDIKIPGLPLGLSGDPGSVPIYKNGEAVGGIGIEGDGVYTVDRDPSDFDQPFEEVIAVSGGRGFEAPSLVRGDNILVDGIRLAYLNVTNAPSPPT